MGSYAQREDVQEAGAWLTENIRTTTDAATLQAMLRKVYLLHEHGTGCRSLSYDHAIRHYFGPGPYTETINTALENIRQSYGRLWNYTGD